MEREELQPGCIVNLRPGESITFIRDSIEDLGITYGGRGPGGEYYSKQVDPLTSISIWTEGEESWTPEELEAIAQHKRGQEIADAPDSSPEI